MTTYTQSKQVRISITPAVNGKSQCFTVKVLDGKTLVYSEDADGVASRDKLVWRLADLYNAVDIELEGKVLKPEFRFSEIPTIPALDSEELETFVDNNPLMVCRRILQAVDEGLRADRQEIRLFELSGTGVYLTSERSKWSAGVKQANKVFLERELYLQCAKARDLLKELDAQED